MQDQLHNNGVVVRGGGQVVSMLALYYDDPSLNPDEACSLFCKMCAWKNENKQKDRVAEHSVFVT